MELSQVIFLLRILENSIKMKAKKKNIDIWEVKGIFSFGLNLGEEKVFWAFWKGEKSLDFFQLSMSKIFKIYQSTEFSCHLIILVRNKKLFYFPSFKGKGKRYSRKRFLTLFLLV